MYSRIATRCRRFADPGISGATSRSGSGGAIEIEFAAGARMRITGTEYRARVITETIPEFAEFARDKEDLVNRVATLGSMLASENAVLSQCLVPNRFAGTTAGSPSPSRTGGGR